MMEFAHFKGEFKSFLRDEPRRPEFLGKLIKSLYKPPRFVVVGRVVDVKAFAELPAEKTVTFKHDPCLFAFLICVRGAVDSEYIQHLPIPVKVRFEFDRRDDLQHQALDLFNAVKRMPTIPHRESLDDIASTDRVGPPPLRALTSSSRKSEKLWEIG